METRWEHRLMTLAGEPGNASHSPALSFQGRDRALQAAYDISAAVTRQHSKSFYLASALLPALKRQAIRALYAFCRTVDDIVDACAECDNLTDLEAWRQIIRSALAPEQDPVATAWVDTLTRFHIPRHYALQLIDGVARDLAVTRYATFDDLSTYCYGVASTVGLMSMHIVGFRSRDALPYAIKLGVALQMTNILRDVGEDFRKGRVYLPQDELQGFGVYEADLANGRPTNRWCEFMRFQIDRTRRLYAEASPGIRLLDPDGQLAIEAASGLYRGILDTIEKNGYDVFSRRASLSAWEKLTRIPGLFVELQGRRWG
jgi:phytoene synthase